MCLSLGIIHESAFILDWTFTLISGGSCRTCPCPQETRAVASRWGCCLHGSEFLQEDQRGDETAFTAWRWTRKLYCSSAWSGMWPQHGSITGYNCKGASPPSGQTSYQPLWLPAASCKVWSPLSFSQKVLLSLHRSVKYLQGVRKAVLFRRISRGKD